MNGNRWPKLLVLLLLLASTAEFLVRGPIRLAGATGWNDFLSPFIQARAWVHGEDPYSARSIVEFWPVDNPRPNWFDRDVASGMLEKRRGMPTPYPIVSLVVLSLFTVFSWTAAMWVWAAISVVAVLLSFLALISLCGCSLFEIRSQLFLACGLALAPLHTGIATANPAVLGVSLTILTLWASRAGMPNLAGCVLAFAICLKPTVAAGLLLYFVIRRFWRIAAIAALLSLVVAALGIFRMQLAGVPWFTSYLQDTHKIFAPGSLADFARGDAIRFNMINAQVFLYSMLRSSSAANLLAWAIAIGGVACWLWFSWRGRADQILEVRAILILGLIPVYHRFYDAVLLMWPLAWALLITKKRSASPVIVLLVSPFFVPGPIVLSNLVESGKISSALTARWWWEAFVLAHDAWLIILLAFTLLYWMAREPGEATADAQNVPATSELAEDPAASPL